MHELVGWFLLLGTPGSKCELKGSTPADRDEQESFARDAWWSLE